MYSLTSISLHQWVMSQLFYFSFLVSKRAPCITFKIKNFSHLIFFLFAITISAYRYRWLSFYLWMCADNQQGDSCVFSRSVFSLPCFAPVIPLTLVVKVIVQTFALKKWWFYENFVPGPQNLRGVSFFKVFMSFHKKIILNHFGNQFWEIRNRNFENQLIWNFCSGNIVKIELRMFFFAKT